MYLLDTDTCIFLLNRKNLSVELKLRTLKRDEIAVSTVTMAELYYGAAHSEKREANKKRVEVFCSSLTVLPFDEQAGEIFGTTKESLVSQGTMIGVIDLLIASVALAQKAILVTHNLQEFRRVQGLEVEDWFEKG